MKFLVFSDFHYYPNRYMNPGFEGLRKLQKAAEDAGCDMIIQLGDFTHGPTTVKEFVDEYNNFHIPSYNCLGNHDTELCDVHETIKAYKMPDVHYTLDIGGYRFIIVDTSYFFDGEKYQPYYQENYFAYPNTRETLPPEEIAFIKESIETSPYPCIICSHASFERYDDVTNRHLVTEIIDEANRKKPLSVIMCMNGHRHKDHTSIINNVIYQEITSPAFDCASAPPTPPHDKFKKEDYEEYRYAGWIICPNDILYYIITLEGTTVTVEGSAPTTMYCGIGHKELGMPEYDRMGRKYNPFVGSYKITLH